MASKSLQNDARVRWLLACITLACYLLVYTGRVTSADGSAILAVTAALVRHGNADISIVGAEDALFERDMSRMGVLGQDGALYSKKGITPSLALIPLVFAAQLVPWLPIQATASLFNPLVTSLTVCLLFSMVRRIGFSVSVGMGVSLICGLATTAFPYTNTLFGEPLAALLVLAAVYALERRRASADVRWPLLAGAALGCAVGINLSYMLMALTVGMFLLVIVLASGAQFIRRQVIAEVFIYAIPIILMLLLIGFYNWARFGNALNSGYYFEAGEGFTRPIPAGLFGLFLSPYRGLVWYSPMTLAAVPGLLLLRKQHPSLTALIITLVFVQAVTYAGWWSWHGGVVWGPRFLVPILPLLSIGFAPVLKALISAAAPLTRNLRSAFVLLLAASIWVQIAGAFISVIPHYGYLVANYGTGVVDSLITGMNDAPMFDPGLSAVFGHTNLLLRGESLEPSWLRGGIDVAIPLTSAGLVALAIAMLRIRRGWRVIGVLGLLAALNMVAARQNRDPGVQAAARLDAALSPPGTALIASTHYGPYLLDVKRGNLMSANAPSSSTDRIARGIGLHALRSDTEIWYVTWFPAGDPANWQERELWLSAAFETERLVDGHRALRFHLNPPPADTAGGWRYGTILLAAYAAKAHPHGVFVTLDWVAEAAPEAGYQWFVHLVDPSGTVITQQDRVPLGSYPPTSGETSSEVFTDYLFLGAEGIMQNLADWRLYVGWVDIASGQRLAAYDPEGSRLPNDFAVIPLAP